MRIQTRRQTMAWGVNEYAAAKGLDAEMLRDEFHVSEGMWYNSDTGSEEPCVIIPYFDAAQKMFRERIRLAPDEDGKKVERWGKKGEAYECGSRGSNELLPLYGLNLIDTKKPINVLVVEGESDVQACRQMGFPAVGVPGALLFNEYMAMSLKMHPNITVYIHDEADSDAAKGFVASALKYFGNDILVFSVSDVESDCKDPCDLLKRYGTELGRRWLDEAINQGGIPDPEYYIGKSYDMPKSKQGTARFDQTIARDYLNEKCGACLIDGVPAVFKGGRYITGANAVDDELKLRYDFSKKRDRAETFSIWETTAKKVEQADRNLISFTNGVLDPRTMKFDSGSPDCPIPFTIPCKWNPDAECDAVDTAIINMACEDPGTAFNLTELIGLAMTRRTDPPYLFFLVGSGQNGKSMYLKMLESVIGRENTSHLQPYEFGKQFQVKDLAGKALNIGDDASSMSLNENTCANLKNASNGAGTRSDVKLGDAIEFDNYATIVFSVNTMPKLADTTHGFMRRFVPIEFAATFAKGSPDYDPDIMKKVSTKEAIERLAYLGVEGIRRVIENNGITENKKSNLMKESIKTDNDTALMWLEYTGYGCEYFIRRDVTATYSEYKNWCASNLLEPKASNSFGRTLSRELGLESKPDGHGNRRYARK